MLANGIAYSRFDVAGLPPQQQLLAYWEQLGHIIELVPSREQVRQSFICVNDRYDIGEFRMSDTYTDHVVIERTIARISRDTARGIGFTIFMDGETHSAMTHATKREYTVYGGSVFATDLDQPIRLQRQACRYITLVVPRNQLGHVFPDPGAIHGRMLDPNKPGTRLVVRRARSLVENFRYVPLEDARRGVADLVQLIVDAFGEDAGLSGSKRAVSRALMFESARRHVRANLHECGLSPESVIESLRLPRSTIYRLFEHEGGLGAYIRHLRLRAAADDLVRFPTVSIKDIGYSVGFKSASDFTRAFRRVYETTPQEMRLNDYRYLPAEQR
ncbi:helix-turn-helix domain-containing protein [Paraburkholderia sp. Tr-20389]|uniref:helix-turn-helix domain-containing protein n=1 Tax=Paraburkholderia sp. Tr-20389 TaxID=2703903 RepID=UPI00197D7622|nr:helix-turn-helix domain-containing protein [Paraburkholderia sp. Tr-20389]MBN3753734.1 helix-turn-helix domain-containing protein [Paraburkholderia sp. Tr-20389]